MNKIDPRAFTIQIYLPQGNSEGVRIISKSNWRGCGVVCPRPLLLKAIKEREELSNTGIYVLVNPSEEKGLPSLYIGEADPVGPRLKQHFLEKEDWTWLVLFISKDQSLNKAHAKYLEHRLVELATEVKRAHLKQNKPQIPNLTEPEQADMESFLRDMLCIFPLVGLNTFQKAEPLQEQKSFLTIKNKSGVFAKGFETESGFVILKGSYAAEKEVKSTPKSLSNFRKTLQDEQVLTKEDNRLRFTQDYTFSSPSRAAEVVLGRSSNGRIEWKDEKGQTLKAIQEAQAKS